MVLYGIKNCNTVKNAVTWLNGKKVKFEFHDYKSKGITEEKLKAWSKQVGWENLVNKRGTTWRQLGRKYSAKDHKRESCNRSDVGEDKRDQTAIDRREWKGCCVGI